MQSVRSRIWTRVAVSISCDDNHYTTGTSKHHGRLLNLALICHQTKHTKPIIYFSDVVHWNMSQQLMFLSVSISTFSSVDPLGTLMLSSVHSRVFFLILHFSWFLHLILMLWWVLWRFEFQYFVFQFVYGALFDYILHDLLVLIFLVFQSQKRYLSLKPTLYLLSGRSFSLLSSCRNKKQDFDLYQNKQFQHSYSLSVSYVPFVRDCF